MANTLKTVVLLAALTGLLLFVGDLIGGTSGLTIALVVAFLMNFVSYWFSDKIALSMAGAREVSPEDAPELHQVVARVAAEAGLPKPRVYLVDTASPNAFATGRDPKHAAVAVTTGLLGILDWDDLEGVIGHEMSHVRNRDTLIAAVAATIAGAITYLARIAQWGFLFGGYGSSRDNRQGGGPGVLGSLLLIILAPIAALLIQLAISRGREYKADADGARITGKPLALADALERLERGVALRPMRDVPAVTAPLFIVNPLPPGFLSSLFSDHPPIAERVARLRTLAFQQIR
ncbi:MAG TPA: zinc metalloprotease HtpX [Chloroflexota bacterium]|nr:zinc metalloprotease HtpX [Chloroflexota bacterium]